VGQVEPHTAGPGAAALLDLRVGRRRHPVPAAEFHSLGVVARHETLTEVVEQDATLAASRLADEYAGRVLRPDQPEGVELHQLGVTQPGTRLDGEAEGVAGVLVATRGGTSPDARVPSGREDHGVGVHEVARAVDDVESIGTEHRPVVDQQPSDVHARQDGNGELPHAFAERSPHLRAGVLVGEHAAAVRLVVEPAFGRPAVTLPVEACAVAPRVVETLRGTAGHDLRGAWVGQQAALPQRVGRMLFLRVTHAGGGRCPLKTSGCHHSVNIVGCAFGHRDDRDTGLGDFDGRPEA
jgi:hypothetical protein